MTLKLSIQNRVLKYNQSCSNYDTGLTFTIFMTWSNLVPNTSALLLIQHRVIYSQACSYSAYPVHSGERYRTNGPLVCGYYHCLFLYVFCFSTTVFRIMQVISYETDVSLTFCLHYAVLDVVLGVCVPLPFDLLYRM